MDHRRVVTCAWSTVLATVAVTAAAHQAGEVRGKERCFGVAKAGQNHCANLSGSHDCAGRSNLNQSLDEWQYVPRGTCRKLKGFSEAEARVRLGLPKKP